MANRPNLESIGPLLLTTREAAAVLGIGPETLKWWRVRSQRKGPDFIKIGDGVNSRVRYLRQDLIRWINSRTVRMGKGRRG